MAGTSYPVASAIGFMPDGQVLGQLCPQTNFAAGNSEFFDPASVRLVQLRPIIQSDVGPDGMGRSANAILWVRDDVNLWYVAYYVRVPPHLRKNNRAGVMTAVKYIKKHYSRAYNGLGPIIARTLWRDAPASP